MLTDGATKHNNFKHFLLLNLNTDLIAVAQFLRKSLEIHSRYVMLD